ncbi:MAG: homoserine dehydrogenase [Clostridia bacterium]|nr:homoserine dehydrogenase [Clostridia bacterium]
MKKIAILGFGVVGSGIYEVMSDCKTFPLSETEIKYILDRRSFPGHPLNGRVTDDIDRIVNDPEIAVVVETMGGIEPAHRFSLAALKAGKSVVTSNKAVVDKYGEELERTAAENGVCYLYEASVGGGIPLIAPLRDCFTAERITRIAGILNGTTNYILTTMLTEKRSFADALASAQSLGYAEADPHDDVAGIDPARKIAILAGIAFGNYISYESIPVIEGIENVTSEDIVLADHLGCRIKLLAVAEKAGDRAILCVAPFLVGFDHLFHAVNGVQNAVSVIGSSTGESVFYGPGAGSLPTASAVCADIVRALSGQKAFTPRAKCADNFAVPAEEFEFATVTLPNGKKYRMI